ncbi:MAG: diacylglycerol kinase family protein [Candidatus Korobacteraceae bacterium]
MLPAGGDFGHWIGGDGSIHRHLGGLAFKQIPTLIVPLGSANDFARSIGFASVSWTRNWAECAVLVPSAGQ